MNKSEEIKKFYEQIKNANEISKNDETTIEKIVMWDDPENNEKLVEFIKQNFDNLSKMVYMLYINELECK